MIKGLRAALLAGAAATSSCTLIDQTTFAPEPDPKPAPVAAAAPAAASPAPADARVPLLTIRYDVPAPDYGTVLPIAVRTARQRRPGVAFNVVSVIASAADAPQGQADAAEVSRAIAKLGVPADRIHLGLRVDPAATLRAVLVYPS